MFHKGLNTAEVSHLSPVEATPPLIPTFPDKPPILLPISSQNPLPCNLLRISCQMKFLFRKKETLAVEACEASRLAASGALVAKPIIRCQGFRCAEGCD